MPGVLNTKLNTKRLNKQFLELPGKLVSGSSSNVPPTMVVRIPRQMFGNNAPYCAGGTLSQLTEGRCNSWTGCPAQELGVREGHVESHTLQAWLLRGILAGEYRNEVLIV